MMAWVWGIMLFSGIAVGIIKGDGAGVADAMITGSGEALTLCLNLAGAYMLWMGIMEIAKRSGVVESLAKAVQPLLKRLFPRARAAIAPITLNLAANFFGMGNAATPFGLEAMKELEKLNTTPGRASDEMCMFIALNASALELLPTTILAMRSAAGSQMVNDIVVPTLISSVVAFVVAVALARLLARVFK